MPDFSVKMHQIQFRLGLHLWESLQSSSDRLAGGEGAGCPLLKNTTPLSTL